MPKPAHRGRAPARRPASLFVPLAPPPSGAPSRLTLLAMTSIRSPRASLITRPRSAAAAFAHSPAFNDAVPEVAAAGMRAQKEYRIMAGRDPGGVLFALHGKRPH